MIKVDNDTKTISINRGDDKVGFIFSIPTNSGKYIFQVDDEIKFSVYNAKELEKNALIYKLIVVESETDSIDISFTKEETSIGEILNKPVTYWYEIQLNDNTIIGYDEEGAKKFIVYPEGSDEQ